MAAESPRCSGTAPFSGEGTSVQPPGDLKMLNIGCGATYHPAWVNIDVGPVSPQVIRHDAGAPLPFAPGSFDACYCSHLLEHLSVDRALSLLSEVHRVLKPGGVFRVVVPDLEGIVRSYLGRLEESLRAEDGPHHGYDWAVLELLDQMVRHSSGGRMAPYLAACPIPAREFIRSRIGLEAERFWETDRPTRPFLARLAALPAWLLLDRMRYLAISGCAWLLGGKRGMCAVQEGWFVTSGETHLWMYDRFSLGRTLREVGFGEVAACEPQLSRIPGFAGYGLDMVEGAVRKPDSLFMEGMRP